MFVIDMQSEIAANVGIGTRIESSKDSLSASGQIHQQFTTQILDYLNSTINVRSALGLRREKRYIFKTLRSQTKGEVFSSRGTRLLHIQRWHIDLSNIIKHNFRGITFADYLRARENIHRWGTNETRHKEVLRMVV